MAAKRADDTWRARVAAATVTIVESGSQGVLVPGCCVLTAAHAVGSAGIKRKHSSKDERVGTWLRQITDGTLTHGPLGQHEHPFFEQVRTKAGDEFDLKVLAIEAAADIAVLGPMDPSFEKFCADTPPVSLSTEDLDLDAPTPVHVLTGAGTWIEASTVRDERADGATVPLSAKARIEDGTSGGPVVSGAGLLVGLISWAHSTRTDAGTYEGMMPMPHLGLPAWILRRIEVAQKGSR